MNSLCPHVHGRHCLAKSSTSHLTFLFAITPLLLFITCSPAYNAAAFITTSYHGQNLKYHPAYLSQQHRFTIAKTKRVANPSLPISLPLANNNNNNNNDDDEEDHSPNNTSAADETTRRLLDQASKLRKEAEELDAVMQQKRSKSAKTTTTAATMTRPAFKKIAASTWSLKFRFAKDPLDDDDDDDEKKKRRQFFNGSIGIRFREDGYTDLISSNDDDDDDALERQSRSIKFDKLWGWDEEVSNDDGLTYLLFSADVTIMDGGSSNKGTTTTATATTTERFYFQARVDKDNVRKEISLADGTVTVKRDVKRTSTGGKLFWGVFDGGGILAQFRNVGGFTCRPVVLQLKE